MTLSAREITPLAGSGKGEQAGEPVVVAVVGGFHSWRFEGARPGEGDMTFEGVVVAARARRGSLAPVGGRAVRAVACEMVYVESGRKRCSDARRTGRVRRERT